jgi:hypothetical protein
MILANKKSEKLKTKVKPSIHANANKIINANKIKTASVNKLSINAITTNINIKPKTPHGVFSYSKTYQKIKEPLNDFHFLPTILYD